MWQSSRSTAPWLVKFLHSAQDKAVCMEAGVKLHVAVGNLGEVYKHRDHLVPLPVLDSSSWGLAWLLGWQREGNQPCSADRAGQEQFWPALSIGRAASQVWVAASWHLAEDKPVKHSRTKLFLFLP